MWFWHGQPPGVGVEGEASIDRLVFARALAEMFKHPRLSRSGISMPTNMSGPYTHIIVLAFLSVFSRG